MSQTIEVEPVSTSWALNVAWDRDLSPESKFVLVAIASGYTRERDIVERTGYGRGTVRSVLAELWAASNDDDELKRIMRGAFA